MWLIDPIARLVGRALLRLLPRVTVSGIKTMFSDVDVPRNTCLERLSAAIETLRTVDARRGRWLTRYVRYIVIWKGHYSFANPYGGVFISSQYLLGVEIERVAGVIVHETTHHRLKRLGVKTTPPLQARIEAICVGEQADFLRKFGERGDAWAAELEKELLEPWWGEVPQKATIDELVEHGVPRPIAWLMRRRLQSTTRPTALPHEDGLFDLAGGRPVIMPAAHRRTI
jgi:hypothetical protein